MSAFSDKLKQIFVNIHNRFVEVDNKVEENTLHLERLKYYGKDVEPTDASLFEFYEGIEAITRYIGDDTEVVIPYEINGIAVTSISNYAFNGCFNLTSIIIPKSVIEIYPYAFASCNFTSITIPDSVITIGGFAFYECNLLSHIDIPDSVTSIGSYAFYNCSSLASITIPDSVTSIGSGAFGECSSLTVTCNSGSYAEEYCKENNINYVLDTVSPSDLSGGSIAVDQAYDPESANAQSGVAVAEALTDYVKNTELEYAVEACTTQIENYGSLSDKLPVSLKLTENMMNGKVDKVYIATIDEYTGIYAFDFAYSHNIEFRCGEMEGVAFNFGNGEYPKDYTSGISFDSGETPTAINYTDSDILNWVGTDCVTSDGLSIFQPSPNTHYDIVFYFNGVQFVGLVNGFVPATGNVVSE